jgi:hypothetical protein
MKPQHLLFGVIGVALLGGAVYFGKTLGNQPQETQVAGTSASGIKSPTELSSGVSSSAKPGSTSSSTRDRDNAWAALKEKYGDGRTKLSKKVSEDMASLIKDAVELTDMGAKLAGETSAKDVAAQGITQALARQLGLSDEQKEKVSALVATRVTERMDAVNELAAAIQSEPTGMMETILAGDAFSRGEITQEEYDAASAETLAVMRNVSGFALGGMGGGGNLNDPLLAEQLNGVLTPEQQTQLSGIMEKAAARAQNGSQQLPFQNGNLPAMEIEKLEQTMLSAQKLTKGIRGMIEGMQGMKELNPQLGQ